MSPVSVIEQQAQSAFLTCRDRVCRYLSGMLRDPSTAEELAQECFLRLYDRLQCGDVIENSEAWVFRVGRNLALDHLKRPHIESANSMDLCEHDRTASIPSVEEVILEQEKQAGRQRWVRNARKRLSRLEEECLSLRLEGRRFREISDVMGIAIPTAQTLLSRAMRKMECPG